MGPGSNLFAAVLVKCLLDLMTKMQAVFSCVSDEVSLNLQFIPSEEYCQVRTAICHTSKCKEKPTHYLSLSMYSCEQ